jgi:hypothetical protein
MRSLQTLEIQVRNDDDAWWSLVPNIMDPRVIRSFSPCSGLQNLTALYVCGPRSVEGRIDTKVALRLMLLPSLRKLDLENIGSFASEKWTPAEETHFSTLYRISSVVDLRLVESGIEFDHLIRFVKLARSLTSLYIPVDENASLAKLKEELWSHRTTLLALRLFVEDNKVISHTDVLGDLREFSDLRKFEGDIRNILSAEQWDERHSLATLLPTSIEDLELVLHWHDESDDGTMDVEACAWQMREVIEKCPQVIKLAIIGPTEIDGVMTMIEDECNDRGIELLGHAG